jgi:prolyl-tRNA synthetase
VTFQDEDGEVKSVYATSWGVSTRLIGAIIMTHGDDNGVIMPPKLASTQLAIIPITKGEEERNQILEHIEKITISWNGKFSFKVDDREGYRPGWKFNEWEQRGVPLRMEIGPKDLEKSQVILVRRDTGEKIPVPLEELTVTIEKTLDNIQHNLYKTALKFREDNTFMIDNYEEFKSKIEDPGGFFWMHWCGNTECEDRLQEETKATIRCIPLENPFIEAGKCLLCGEASYRRVIAAKAY